MIQCSLCSTSKSERYIFTECGHLVCLNCAALRASQVLQCCDIKTVLDEEVKSQLKAKKQKILDNLSNEYKYERTDVHRVDYDQIEDRLKKIDNLEIRSKRKFEDYIEADLMTERNEEMQNTPMDRFYKNPLILAERKSEISESTPIKLVSNTDQQDEIIAKLEEKSLFHPVLQQKPLKIENEVSTKKPELIQRSQFIPVLQNKIHLVREEFKTIYDQIQKIQANIVYQMKIYFEEYVNLIETQNSQSFNVLTEMERITIFLDQFVEEWNIKEIQGFLASKQNKSSKSTLQQSPKPSNIDITERRQLIYSNKIQPLQSCRINYPSNHKKAYSRDDFMDKLRLSESLETQNNFNPPTSTGRNLDKIYKKLEDSRNKLQERIQIHNEFMNKRCQKMGIY